MAEGHRDAAGRFVHRGPYPSSSRRAAWQAAAALPAAQPKGTADPPGPRAWWPGVKAWTPVPLALRLLLGLIARVSVGRARVRTMANELRWASPTADAGRGRVQAAGQATPDRPAAGGTTGSLVVMVA